MSEFDIYSPEEWTDITVPAPVLTPTPSAVSAFPNEKWEDISVPPVTPPVKPKITNYSDIIFRASKAYGIDGALIRSVVKAESDFRPKAVSKTGAKGLMQLMDNTAKELGVMDPFDPEENIMGGAKYLSQNLKRFGGDTSLALAAYNAGPGNVEEFGGIPPFEETQKYVDKVLKDYKSSAKIPIEDIKRSKDVPVEEVELSKEAPEMPSLAENILIRPFKAQAYIAAEALNRGIAQFEGNLDAASKWVGKKLGMEPGGTFEEGVRFYTKNADYWHKKAEEVGTNIVDEMIGEAVGGAIPGIAEFMLGVPYYSLLGAVEADKRGDSEAIGAIMGGAKRAALGKILQGAGLLKQPYSSAAMGGVFGVQAATEGGTKEEIAKGVGTGALYGLMGGRGKVGLKEIIKPSRLTETQKSIAREAIKEVAEEQRVDLVAEATRRRQAEIKRMEREVEIPPEIPPEPVEPVIAKPLVKPIVEPAKPPIEPVRPPVEPIVRPEAPKAPIPDIERAVESVLEPHGSVLSQFAHGKEKQIEVIDNVRTITTKRGKKYKLDAYIYELKDGKERIALTAGDPANLIDAAAIIRPVEKGVVIESLHGGKTFEGLGGTLVRFIKKRYKDIIPEKEAPLSIAGEKAIEKLIKARARLEKPPIEPEKPIVKPPAELVITLAELREKPELAEYVTKRKATHPEKVIAEAERMIKPEEPVPVEKVKEPWKMTRAEITAQPDPVGVSKYDARQRKQKAIDDHVYDVRKALKEDKPIPRKVLEEYKGETWADKALARIEKPLEVPVEIPRVPIPEKPVAGLAPRKGKEVSFSEYREIKKGKHKGRIRVTWPDGKWSVIDKADVLKWPEKVEIIPEKARPRIFRMTEPTKVTNTRGKEITLPRGEEFMAYDIGKGKIRLQDGKQVTIYEGELSKLRGQMLPPGEEPMAGMIGRREPMLTIKERDALRIKLRAEAKGARTALAAGKRELAKLHKAKMREIRERLKAGFAARVAKIKTTKEILQRRRSKIRAVQEHFGLSDVDLRSITKRDIRLMNNLEFKTFIGDIRIKAEKFAERQQAKNELIAHIKEKELDVENLRKAMKLPTIKNMTTEQFRKLDKALDPYKKRDVFLSVRKLETVDRTELKGIKTWREARERLSKTLGVPVEQLQSIRVSEFDRFRYETGLAERNPFYGMMVEETAKRMLTSQAEYLKIETETFALAKKIKPKGLLRRLIPQQKRVREFMEAPTEKKADIKLTGVEAELAEYMTKHFSEAREYLIQIEAMRMGRENYFTHVRRGILEAIKEDGIVKAVKEQFESYKLDEQGFNILDRETGEILAMDKFFKFAMHRVGKIKPTENVVRAFLTYMRTFKKKQALDEITPLIDIYAHALTPRGMTKKGLLLHGNLIRFVKEWINTQKGRHITLAAKQNGKVDGALRAIKMFTTMRDLAGNIPVSIATELGEQVSTYQLLGKKKFMVGKFRQRQKQGKAIIEKYRNFIGKNPWTELIEPSKRIGDRLMEGIFILFRDASVRANKTFLLGALSKAEFEAGEIAPARLAALKTELGRYRMVEGMSSIIGATPEGKAYTQYKRWAFPHLRTTIKNLNNLRKKITPGQKVSSAEFKQSALELYRLVELTTFVMLAFSTVRDEDDRSFMGKMANKAYREITTQIQALSPRMFLYAGRTVSFVEELGVSLTLLLKAEEYKTKEGYKGIQKLKRQVTPVAISQFRGEKKKEPIRRRVIRPTRRIRRSDRSGR